MTVSKACVREAVAMSLEGVGQHDFLNGAALLRDLKLTVPICSFEYVMHGFHS